MVDNSYIPQGDIRYDAAAANMGAQWNMPTQVQYSELINTNNTIHEWTTINGVNGMKFTNKSDTSKYIFLPAAGVWSESSNGNAGSYGWYWCTEMYQSNTSNAYCLGFFSNKPNLYNNTRYLGLSIRGIQ